jgi:peptidoglycan/LPS O-acetylase OafA/YrhL
MTDESGPVNIQGPNLVVIDETLMRTLVAGGVVAVAIAAMLVTITAGGENGWKFALAALGMVLWILGGLSKNPDPSVPDSGQKGRK